RRRQLWIPQGFRLRAMWLVGLPDIRRRIEHHSAHPATTPNRAILSQVAPECRDASDDRQPGAHALARAFFPPDQRHCQGEIAGNWYQGTIRWRAPFRSLRNGRTPANPGGGWSTDGAPSEDQPDVTDGYLPCCRRGRGAAERPHVS